MWDLSSLIILTKCSSEELHDEIDLLDAVLLPLWLTENKDLGTQNMKAHFFFFFFYIRYLVSKGVFMLGANTSGWFWACFRERVHNHRFVFTWKKSFRLELYNPPLSLHCFFGMWSSTTSSFWIWKFFSSLIEVQFCIWSFLCFVFFLRWIY